QFETLTEWMDWSLADRDVDLDGIYYCPHHPQGSIEEFRQVCDFPRALIIGLMLAGAIYWTCTAVVLHFGVYSDKIAATASLPL
ncbi:hypothetical protein MJI37_35870, partial [Salmonella enterica subsp. enterica serovar Cerro]|nr:hypothetical protein [Salmonella enterica subsp. enterica serovar Cerro]